MNRNGSPAQGLQLAGALVKLAIPARSHVPKTTLDRARAVRGRRALQATMSLLLVLLAAPVASGQGLQDLNGDGRVDAVFT